LYNFDFGNSIIIKRKGLSNKLQIRAKPKQLKSEVSNSLFTWSKQKWSPRGPAPSSQPPSLHDWNFLSSDH